MCPTVDELFGLHGCLILASPLWLFLRFLGVWPCASIADCCTSLGFRSPSDITLPIIVIDERAAVEFVGWGDVRDERHRGDGEARVREEIEDPDDVASQ